MCALCDEDLLVLVSTSHDLLLVHDASVIWLLVELVLVIQLRKTVGERMLLTCSVMLHVVLRLHEVHLLGGGRSPAARPMIHHGLGLGSWRTVLLISCGEYGVWGVGFYGNQ